MRNVNQVYGHIDNYLAKSFILTMRNVNYEVMARYLANAIGFILTMRNVNEEIKEAVNQNRQRFILTMRNVNKHS